MASQIVPLPLTKGKHHIRAATARLSEGFGGISSRSFKKDCVPDPETPQGLINKEAHAQAVGDSKFFMNARKCSYSA